jgi:hypothetical protein
MKTDIPNRVGDNSGVSELIGAMLLILLAIIGIAIISVMLLSSSGSEVIPKVDILAGKSGSGGFYLYNNGGDSLKNGEYRVLVDLNDGNGYVDGQFSQPPGGVWSPGDSITYTGLGIPLSAMLVYTGGETEALLSSSSIVYSNESIADISTSADVGEITPGIGNVTVSPIIITNDEGDLAVEFEARMNEPSLNITMDNSIFIADRVDIVYYDYDNTGYGGSKNAIAKRMTTDNGVDYSTMITDLNVLLSANVLPTNISLSIIAYNETEKTSYLRNVIFEVVRNQD